VGNRTAWVAGGSGLVGGQLLAQLLSEPSYDEVCSAGRRELALRHERLVQKIVSFQSLEAAIPPAADVFCCLGTTIKKAGSREEFRKVDYEYPLAIARAAHAAGARQLLVVTAMGADPGSRVFYNRVKGELERDLQSLGLGTLHILRPSLLLGPRQENRPGERAGAVFASLAGPLMVGPLRKWKAIEAAAVARAMVLLALRPSHGCHVYRSDELALLAAGG
jgi:uncharacterized protein YbjT (DUF2867 family)